MNEETQNEMAGGKTGQELLWEHAIVALLENGSVTDAAEQVGVSSRTLYRLLKEPEFARQYRDARREIVTSTVNRLQSMTGDAARAMHDCLRCDNPAVKLRASQLVIQQALHGLEILEMEQRLQLIEVNLGLGHT